MRPAIPLGATSTAIAPWLWRTQGASQTSPQMMRMFATSLMQLAAAVVAVAAAGPAGDAFYMPPAPLPAATHGDVIWQRPLTSNAALPDAARNILVLYHTTTVNGKDVAVSGTVAVPKGTPPHGGWPVISWTHGTTGDAPVCTPSRDSAANPVHPYLTEVDALLDGFVRHGYAVVQTDYEGQGTPGIHPYLVGEAEGRDAIDMVRAARAVDSSLGSRWVVMGHSQGGHSALFAASLAPGWAPELPLLGVVAMAPASQLGPFLRGMSKASAPIPSFAYAALLIEGYGSVYPAVKPGALLAPSAFAMLPQTQDRCDNQLRASGSWGGIVPAASFRSGADLGPLMAQAMANEPGSLHLAVPALIVQGAADKTVPQPASDALFKQLCAGGANLGYDVYPGVDHQPLVTASGADARAWIDARFAGTPATSGCGSPPTTRS